MGTWFACWVIKPSFLYQGNVSFSKDTAFCVTYISSQGAYFPDKNTLVPSWEKHIGLKMELVIGAET
jgi:hypothetical protein